MRRHANANPPQHLTLPLDNLRCSSDAQVVERVLRRQAGVAEVYANPVTQRVHILYDAALTQPERLQAVLHHRGFGARTAYTTRDHSR